MRSQPHDDDQRSDDEAEDAELLASFEEVLAGLAGRGAGFEELSRWFLLNDPEWSASIKRVWRWSEWPGRWGRDRGIDLVAETTTGDLLAIQCKHYAASEAITKASIDSFLSESNRAAFAGRILIATTQRLAGGAPQVVEAQEKPVTLILRDRLLKAELPWQAFLAKATVKRRRLRPRPHQQRAIDQVVSRFGRERRGQLLMPCGTGKTLTSVWIAKRLGSELTLVLVPTLALLRQTVGVWRSQLADVELLKVCSEKARGSERELVAADLSPLEIGGDTTTDPAVIARFLRGPGRRIVIGTYDSSPRIARAMSDVPDTVSFDLIVCDEAHHCAGVEGGAHRTVLDDVKIRARRRLFVTATPTVFSASAQEQAAHTHTRVASMEDHSRFGHVLHRLSFKQAIEEGLLCPYQVVVMPIRDAEVVDLVKRRRLVSHSGDRITDAYSLAAEIACLRAMREHACTRMVTFHPRVEDARTFAADVVDAGQLLPDAERPAAVEGRAVDGYMNRPKREAILEWFGNRDDSAKMLTNVRLLAEGVDVPEIDGICLIDTRRSAASIVQAVGRAVRTAPGKAKGTIVVPVVVRDDEDVHDALERSEHRNVLEVLAALRSLDSEIRNTVDYIHVELGPRTTGGAVSSWVVDAPLEVDERFAEAVEISLVDLLGAKTSKATAVIDDDDGVSIFKPIGGPREPEDDPLNLETGLKRLRSYRDSHYSGVVHKHTLEMGFPLGEWWEHVMKLWEAGQLSDDVKRACGESMNWIPIKGHRKVRAELSELDPVPVDQRLDDYLGWRYSQIDDRELRGFVERNLIGRFEATVRPGSVLRFVDQQQSKVRQARQALSLLRRVGRAMDEGVEFREEVAGGFFDALTNPGRGHDLDVKLEAGQVPRGNLEAYAFGWEAGQEAWKRLHRPKARPRRGRQQRRRRSSRGEDEGRRAA